MRGRDYLCKLTALVFGFMLFFILFGVPVRAEDTEPTPQTPFVDLREAIPITATIHDTSDVTNEVYDSKIASTAVKDTTDRLRGRKEFTKYGCYTRP